MIQAHQHDDVVRLELTHARSRLIGMSVSAFLVRGVLVDSGFPAIHAELEEFLRQKRLDGAFLTHGHEDHAGNAPLLARLGIPICLSAATEEAIRKPRRIAFYRRYTWGSPEPLRGEVTPFAAPGLHLILAPGHSRDHHVVWDDETGSLFSSDLFLGVKVSIAHASERPRELIRSIRMVLSLGPERMFDAHRGLVPRPRSALEAKVSWMEEVIARIESLAARGWSVPEIQRAVLGREGWPGIFSRGEYSKRNFVSAVLGEL